MIWYGLIIRNVQRSSIERCFNQVASFGVSQKSFALLTSSISSSDFLLAEQRQRKMRLLRALAISLSPLQISDDWDDFDIVVCFSFV